MIIKSCLPRLVGRKFGVNIVPVPDKDTCRQIHVLGISGS